MKLKDILREIEEPTNTFQMYHGGKRWSRIPTEIINSRKNRYEAGVGIYFTNDYNTARRYAKGSRVVHLVDIDKNFKRLKDVYIPVTELVEFVKNASGMRHKTELIQSIMRCAERMGKDTLSADVLNNLIVNHEAGAGKAGVLVANFFVSKGADASIENQHGEEFWLVVFNPKIIKKVSVVDPKVVGSDFPFLLPRVDRL